MLLSQLQSSQPWIPPPRLPRLCRNSPPPSKVMQIQCSWFKHAAFCWHGTTRHKEGKLDVRSQRTKDGRDFRVCAGNRNNFDAKFFARDLNRDNQDPQVRSVTSTMSLYVFLRLSQLNSACMLTKIFQQLLPHLFQKFLASGAPFACISNSLNKPMPLKLDVSLPSLGDIRWNFARMIYLFNIQLERNIAT